MARYGNMTTEDVCKCECEECESILRKYNVSEEDIDTILSMIEQAYYMLTDSYKMMSLMEAGIEKKVGQKGLMEIVKGAR